MRFEAGAQRLDRAGVVEPPEGGSGDFLRRRLVLQQLGDGVLAQEDVGQRHPRLVVHQLAQLPAERVHHIDDDHRPLEERRLERRRAAGDQDDVAGGERVVGAAVEQRDRRVGRVLPAQRLDGVAQPGHDGNDKAQPWARPAHLGDGGEQARRDVADLRSAAAGQHGDQRLVGADAKGGTARLTRHLERDRARERVADVDGLDALLGVDLRLERKDAEHEVGGAADLADAARRARPRSTG